MPFTAFIDESGEAGIAKVRSATQPGASPYFVLGAAVLQPAGLIAASKTIERLQTELGEKKWKHATDFDHSTKVYLAREFSKLNVRFFAVISNKSTLGEYKEKIENDPQKFYNKCVKYLLEKICGYLAQFGVNDDELSVVMERRNHDYDAMIRFLIKVKSNPIYPESKVLKLLNPFAITSRAKDEQPILKIADLVAHSVYQCTNKSTSNHFIPEYRYFEELSVRFGADKYGRILGAGLKPIHNLEMLELDQQIVDALTAARAAPPIRP